MRAFLNKTRRQWADISGIMRVVATPMTSHSLGSLPSGEKIDEHVLTNSAGAILRVMTYGGIVTSLTMPDRNGQFADIVLGLTNLDAYLGGHPYFGAIIGRIAGRVSGAQLRLQGRDYPLQANDGTSHLHGGRIGLDKRLWQAQRIPPPDGGDRLVLTYRSPDGEEGYPGNLAITVTYTLTAANEFIISTEATTDRTTPLSLCHHSYFNLAGENSGSVIDHEVQILADGIVPTDTAMTLSGRRIPVAGSAADLNHPRRLGDVLPQLFQAHGDLYHLRTISAPPPTAPTLVARIVEPKSGRLLQVFTDESCLQFYTASALDGTLIGKSGRCYERHAGFCMECQGYPDGAHQIEFGDILVRPETPQRRTTRYAFSTV